KELYDIDREYQQKRLAEWKEAFGQIGRGFEDVVRGLLQGTSKVGDLWKHFGESLVSSILGAQFKRIEEALAEKAAGGGLGKVGDILGTLFGVKDKGKPDDSTAKAAAAPWQIEATKVGSTWATQGHSVGTQWSTAGRVASQEIQSQ